MLTHLFVHLLFDFCALLIFHIFIYSSFHLIFICLSVHLILLFICSYNPHNIASTSKPQSSNLYIPLFICSPDFYLFMLIFAHLMFISSSVHPLFIIRSSSVHHLFIICSLYIFISTPPPLLWWLKISISSQLISALPSWMFLGLCAMWWDPEKFEPIWSFPTATIAHE